MPQDRLRKLNDENRELAKNLKKEMDSLRQRASTKAIATSSKKKAAGSDLSSTRGGSEERNSSVPAAGRGQKRGRDFDFDKVGKVTSPFRTSSVSSRDLFLDHPDSPPGSPGPGVKRRRTSVDLPLHATMPRSPPTICQVHLKGEEAGSANVTFSPFHGSKLPSTTSARSSPQSSTGLSTPPTSSLSTSPPSHSVTPSRPVGPTIPINDKSTLYESPQNSSSGLSSPPPSSDSSPTTTIKIIGPKSRRGRSNAPGRQGNDRGKGFNAVSDSNAFYAPHVPGRDYYHGELVNLMHLEPEFPTSRIENPYWEVHPRIQKLRATQDPSSRLAKQIFFQGQNPSAVLMIAGVPIEDEAFKHEIRGLDKHPSRKKRKVDTLPLQEEAFHSRASVRIPVPDHLKSILVDDWENVTKNLSLVPLPSKTPVNLILTNYFDEEKGKRRLGSAEADLLEEVVAGVKEYFAKCLGRILLYRFEREQFFEVRQLWESGVAEWEGKGPGDVYGAEHLCRLFGKHIYLFRPFLFFLWGKRKWGSKRK